MKEQHVKDKSPVFVFYAQINAHDKPARYLRQRCKSCFRINLHWYRHINIISVYERCTTTVILKT